MPFPSVLTLPGVGSGTEGYLNTFEGIYLVDDIIYIIKKKKVEEDYSYENMRALIFNKICRNNIEDRYVEEFMEKIFNAEENYRFDQNSIIGRHLFGPNPILLEVGGCVLNFCRRQPQRQFGCGHGVCHFCYLEKLYDNRWIAAVLPEESEDFPHLQNCVQCPVCDDYGGARPI